MINVGKIKKNFKKLQTYSSEYGVPKTAKFALRKITAKVLEKSSLSASDPIKGFRFLDVAPCDLIHRIDIDKKSINWVIPPFGRGAGGHMTIFRFISHLEEMGFKINVVVVSENEIITDEETLKTQINQWFKPFRGQVFIGMKNTPAAHITVATEWRTAYYVRAFQKTNHRVYFVQDFEPWFFPPGSESSFAEETYRFGFLGITAGDWLKEKLAKEYGMTTHAIRFSCDHDLYTPKELQTNAAPKRKRIFFYARPPTARRGFELGVLALESLAKKLPDIEVVFAGWDLSDHKFTFQYESHGIVSWKKLPDIYRSCDVALVLSMSNLSLLPLELMACGTPVVVNCGPFNEWLLNEQNTKLSRPTPNDLASSLYEVLTNQDEYSRLRRAGLETAAKTNWESEAVKMASVFDSLT